MKFSNCSLFLACFRMISIDSTQSSHIMANQNNHVHMDMELPTLRGYN